MESLIRIPVVAKESRIESSKLILEKGEGGGSQATRMEKGYTGDEGVKEDKENGELVEMQRSTACLTLHSLQRNFVLCL